MKAALDNRVIRRRRRSERVPMKGTAYGGVESVRRVGSDSGGGGSRGRRRKSSCLQHIGVFLSLVFLTKSHSHSPLRTLLLNSCVSVTFKKKKKKSSSQFYPISTFLITHMY